jgi:predicted nucleic acid-binding protein
VIVVDTSVWIAAFWTGPGREARVLRQLLDAGEVALPAPVCVEILSGASKNEIVRLRRLLSALPVLYPTAETWRLIDGWIERAVRAGQRFGAGDLLIAALTAETGGLVWSLDADFVRLRRLKLVELYEPPHE